MNTNPAPTPPPPWWETFYDENLADMLLEQTSAAEIRSAADFLIQQLHLRPGATVLDQCCGSGRLAWELALRGYAMRGMDLIPAYIERARRRESTVENAPRFEVADAFVFKADPPCDAVFNWWTSFGYSDADETNQLMLRRAWESLRSGGFYALDFMNVPGLYRHFLPHVVTRNGEVTLIRESTLDLPANVIRKQWTYFLPDGRRVVHDSAVRLYDPAALRRLFEGAGFTDVTFFGDVDASPLTLKSPRCIVRARKPL
ncbi:class I SAM-dependent methyltransferase [Prosthecobacter sp.]|uniref:class I SAM-dependent methyltransferase n=1 Tax=Prosthecobacter sp. TaxID=1965333 RepID=UPI00378372FD